MTEFLGVFVEPWEVESTRANKIHDAFYGFDKKCVVSDVVDRYGQANLILKGMMTSVTIGNQMRLKEFLSQEILTEPEGL